MNYFHQISLLIIFYILVLQFHLYYANRKDINDKNDKFEPEMNSIPNFDPDKLPNLVDLLHEKFNNKDDLEIIYQYLLNQQL